MKDYSFYNRAIELDPKNAGKYYAGRAVLYFYDMEYELAWQDFQKALELGENIKKNEKYKYLAACRKFENNGNMSEKLNKKQVCYQLINYYLIKNNYSKVLSLLSEMYDSEYLSLNFYNLMKNIVFCMEKYRLKVIISEDSDREQLYFLRIRFYDKNMEFFNDFEKRLYRQRINQDFETLEKISKYPEFVYLMRAKYFESNNELDYAIKFCKKALTTVQGKNNEAWIYIITQILKTLYIKNNNIEAAIQTALKIADIKPLPAVLKKELRKIYYIPGIYQISFPPEILKFRPVYKTSIQKMRKRNKNNKYSDEIMFSSIKF